jgi:hypothetical protein
MVCTMPETAIAQAFRRAGGEAGPSKLTAFAYETLRKANRNPIVAHDLFVDAVLQDAGMLRALIGDVLIREKALRFLQDRRSDMVRGGPATQTDGGGYQNHETQSTFAPPSAPLPGEGQHRVDAQSSIAQPRQTEHDGGGQLRNADHQRLASPVVALRSPAERMAALTARSQTSASVMETYKLPDGTPIGEVYIQSVPRLKVRYRRSAALLSLIESKSEAQANNPDAKVKDFFKADDMAAMIRAAEASNAA